MGFYEALFRRAYGDPVVYGVDLTAAMKEQASTAKKSYFLASAYIKLDTLKAINAYLPSSVQDKTLVLCGRDNDFMRSMSDWEAVKFAQENGWTVYFNHALHGKTSIADDNQSIIGSANATKSGTGLNESSRPNDELCVILPCTPNLLRWKWEQVEKALWINKPMFNFLDNRLNQRRHFTVADDYMFYKEPEFLRRYPQFQREFARPPQGASTSHLQSIMAVVVDILAKPFHWIGARQYDGTVEQSPEKRRQL